VHELAVTQSLLDIAIKHAEKANAERITDLYLVIGQLSSIIDDSVQFYWDFVSEGSVAEGATLHFNRIPAKFQCLDCSNEYVLTLDDYSCPRCKSLATSVIQGDEFYLQSIIVEEKE